LLPYTRNSRTHSDAQVAQVAASIEEFGFVGSIVVRDGTIAKGHATLRAAQLIYAAGRPVFPAPGKHADPVPEPFPIGTLPVLDIHGWSDAQFRAYVIADNQLALTAGWDMEVLRFEIIDLQETGFDVNLLGFPDLTEVLALPIGPDPERDPDAAPPVPVKPVTKRGDMWQLGAHLVRCGDATAPADWDALMDGALADICWTDPPYNVAYGGKAEMLERYDKGHRNTDRIKNDDLSDPEFRKFLAGAYAQAFRVLKPGAAIYVAHAETERLNFTEGFKDAGFKLSVCIIWRKNVLVLGRSPYQWIHEPILYGWKPGKAHRWFGGRKQTSVQDWGDPQIVRPLPDGKFQLTLGDTILVVDGTTTIEQVEPSVLRFDKPVASTLHPTMKPVGLIARMLRNSARRGDLVIDGFGGSGSTLIAADTLGMEARLLELDEGYVDVIVGRWQVWTGRRAVHATTGKEFPAKRNTAAKPS